jgi:hypothetical protein
MEDRLEHLDEPGGLNPWCHGPPHTLRHVAENAAGAEGVYSITASEHPDGSGRAITVEIKLDDPTEEDLRNGMDTYSIWLEPPFESQFGGIAECVIADRTLQLRLTPDTGLSLGPLLQFHLALDDDQLALLGHGLRRILSAGRFDQRPTRLELETI